MNVSSARRLAPLLLPALLVACQKQADEEPAPIRPAQVWETAPAALQRSETYSGEIRPRQTVDVAFRVSGKLVSRAVELGERVEQGQELAQLDNEDARLNVNQSESGLQASLGALAAAQGNLSGAQGRQNSAAANLRAAQAGLETAQTAVDAARASAAAALASVGVAQAELQNAQLEYNRSATLVKQGYASKTVLDRDRQRLQTAQASLKSAQANAAATRSQVDSAQARVKTAQAQAQAAQGDVESARANVSALQGQIQSAQAQVDSQQNQLNLVKNQSGYTRLASPATGVITATQAEPGQVVSAGQPIVSLARAGKFDVHIRVGEQAISRLQPGMPARVSLWAEQNLSLPGEVREIAPAADANRTWLVKIAVQSGAENQLLKLGMTATVRFDTPQTADSKAAENTLVWLPATALFQQEQQPAVWRLDANSKVELHPVQVAQYLNDGLLVSGLDAGEKVVAAGVNRLYSGQPVNPVPYNGAARPADEP